MPNVTVSIRPVFPVIRVSLTQPTSAPATFTPAIPGAPGGDASISADPTNQLAQGSDNALFVPPPQLSSAQW